MFIFFGRLFLLVTIGVVIGLLLGFMSGSPATGTAAFLIFVASFRKTVFETLPRD